jgi:tetratricopeptide (TPR) repeat protein
MSGSIKLITTILFYILLITSGSATVQNSDLKSETDKQVQALLDKANKNAHIDSEKAIKYLNEALKYKDEISDKQLLFLYKIATVIFTTEQSNLLALDYGYKTLALQKKIDPTQMHFTYNNIAVIYMQLGNAKKSRQFLNKSLEGLKQAIAKGTLKEKEVEAYLVYGNLAIIEIEEKNYIKALEMLHIYEKQSLRLKDTAGVIFTYQNLSNVHNTLKQTDSSLYYSDKGIRLSKKTNLLAELSSLYYYRGLNYNTTNKDSALYYMQEAFNLGGERMASDVKLSSSKMLADLYEDKNDYKKSNYYLRIAGSLSEENLSQESKKKIEILELENEQKRKQQEALIEAQRTENILIFSFILLVPVSVIVFLMYRLQRTKANQRKIENELLVQKMEGKNRELTSNAIQILQANEIIDYTQKGLSQLKTVIDTPNNKMLTQIISDLKKGNQSFNKKEFEKLFIETDEEFYKKLLQQYPSLTKNEIRLCAFAKMNFSTKEISAITQQSSNSILVARSRLRKKIGLADNQSLTGFFKSF